MLFLLLGLFFAALLPVIPSSSKFHGDERFYTDAALAIGRYLGGSWAGLAAIAGLVPRPLRDLVYRLVARIRYRTFGRYDACPLPPVGQRSRFLD